MKITTTRKISQIFFLVLFIWLCVVTTLGNSFHNLRSWPVNIFLHLDPLTAIATVLSTHKLFAPLLWSVLTIVLTILIGRFFCGWVCPFGSLHQAISYLVHRKKSARELADLHKYRRAQNIKYYILIIFLVIAALPSMETIYTGLLDPIPLFTRTVNLLLLPVADNSVNFLSAIDRFYQTAPLILAVFMIFVILNFFIPRFFCLFICPLGALFGILNRFALLRINRNEKCTDCKMCNKHCQGSCQPSETVKLSECLLCFNCLDDCGYHAIDFNTKSADAIQAEPDMSRRGFVAAAFTGLLTMPAFRLAGATNSDNILRPPGSLSEEEFAKRCIKCGQCIRVCPTNVIQPAGIEKGLENLWTPTMNNRIGSSGCQLDCVACGFVCPTSAIRPLTLAEKLGKGKFEDKGPVKIGTASFDKTRCLPWARNIPCIVCEENCPVSPKAIYTRTVFVSAFDKPLNIESCTGNTIYLSRDPLPSQRFSTGDYYCLLDMKGQTVREKIISNSANTIQLASGINSHQPTGVKIEIKLQRPYVDPLRCIGCGICQHECPVSGSGAVIVTPYGQSRNK
ncbi:MAG: 4Fe-4S binding protein [Sedimentisphaerales bacterium]|nr:4Fe-4S binding protein [Sedimentisphaerales bacterium]